MGNCALIMHKITSNFGTSLKMLAPLFEKAIKDGWKNVYMLGTHADVAGPARTEQWVSSFPKVFKKFFQNEPGMFLPISMHDKDSLHKVRKQIGMTCESSIAYEQVSTEEVTNILAEVTGIDVEDRE